MTEQTLYRKKTDGYPNVRIPSICVTTKGTLLAFAEGREGGDAGDIDTLVRRSEDHGKTWSPIAVVWNDGKNTCGNPAPVVDAETGTIWLFSTWNVGSDHEGMIMAGKSKDIRRVFASKSTDDGKTWSTPKDLSETLRRPEWRWYATGPCNGIQLTRGPHKGRLVMPANHSDKVTEKPTPATYHSHVIYSDDHGETWKLGGVHESLTNESTVVELADGAIMQNMRSYHGKHNRAAAISNDGGLTFEKQYLDDALQSPVCQGSLLRYSWPEEGRSRILFASPAGKGREAMTVRLSYDEGKTWPVSKLLHPGGSAYSNLVRLANGRIGLLYEKNEYAEIVFASFPLEWLTP
jgi:sialidase-1